MPKSVSPTLKHRLRNLAVGSIELLVEGSLQLPTCASVEDKSISQALNNQAQQTIYLDDGRINSQLNDSAVDNGHSMISMGTTEQWTNEPITFHRSPPRKTLVTSQVLKRSGECALLSTSNGRHSLEIFSSLAGSDVDHYQGGTAQREFSKNMRNGYFCVLVLRRRFFSYGNSQNKYWGRLVKETKIVSSFALKISCCKRLTNYFEQLSNIISTRRKVNKIHKHMGKRQNIYCTITK